MESTKRENNITASAIIPFEYLMIPLTFCFLGYFNGREHTTFVMAQGLFTSFLIRIPLSYALSRIPNTGMLLISLAVPASSLCNLLLCVAYFIWLRRKDRAARISCRTE